MTMLISAVLTQCLYVIADATGEVDIGAGVMRPFCGEMFEVIMEIVIVCVVFSITTKLMNRAGSLKKPAKKLDSTPKRGTSDVCTSEACYNSALQKQADIGNLSGCAELCKEMRARNIEPSETTFLILFDACINAEDFDRACSLLEDLCQAGTPFSSTRFLQRIKALVDVGRLDEARELLEKIMPAFGVCQQPSIFQSMLKAYAGLGDHRGWVRTFNLAARSGILLDALAIEAALAFFPSRFAQSQDIFGLFEALIAHGLHPSQAFLSAAVRSMSKIHAWETALNFLSAMQSRFDVRPEAFLYEQLAFACAKSGDVKSMNRIYSAMTEAVGPTAEDNASSRDKSGGSRFQGVSCSWRSSTTPCATNASQSGLSFTVQQNDGQSRSNRLNQFIHLNRLDSKTAQTLRRMPSAQSDWVMDQEFIIQVNHADSTSSSRVLSTISRLQSKSDDFWKSYPTESDLERRLSDFNYINNLDVRCLKTLEKLSPESRQWVMDQEFVIQVDPSKGTASAKVIGRVVKLRNSW